MTGFEAASSGFDPDNEEDALLGALFGGRVRAEVVVGCDGEALTGAVSGVGSGVAALSPIVLMVRVC